MQSPTIIYRVYKHTSISGKGYIGYTYKPLMKRWKGEVSHSRNLNNVLKIDKAIRKYSNKDQWNHDILIDNIPTLAEAKRLEIEMIAKYDTYKNGYNSTPGGDGHGPNSEECKKNMRHPHKKGQIPWNKGMILGPPSEENRKKQIEAVSKTYQITYPSGETKIIKNLKQFCKDNNLGHSCMYSLAQRKRPHHKGFKCIKIS